MLFIRCWGERGLRSFSRLARAKILPNEKRGFAPLRLPRPLLRCLLCVPISGWCAGGLLALAFWGSGLAGGFPLSLVSCAARVSCAFWVVFPHAFWGVGFRGRLLVLAGGGFFRWVVMELSKKFLWRLTAGVGSPYMRFTNEGGFAAVRRGFFPWFS